MAVPEARLVSEYREPALAEAEPEVYKDGLLRVKAGNYLGQKILHGFGFRTKMVIDNKIFFEWKKKGVLRYPPVYVDRQPTISSVASYINLTNKPPTNWQEAFRALPMVDFIDQTGKTDTTEF